MIGLFVNNELEMDRRNCPCLILPLELPTWRRTSSKEVHCTLHNKTYAVHWSSYWKWPVPTTKHASHLVNTWLKIMCNDCLHITDTTRLKTSSKSSSVSVRIDFIRPIPENSATHNSHMALDLVNKQLSPPPPPPPPTTKKTTQRTAQIAWSHT